MFGYEPKGQGFESLAARQKRSDTSVLLLFLFFYKFLRDSNPERVSGVKKTVPWTVFSREVWGGYCRLATVAEHAWRFAACIPCSAPKQKQCDFVLLLFFYSGIRTLRGWATLRKQSRRLFLVAKCEAGTVASRRSPSTQGGLPPVFLAARQKRSDTSVLLLFLFFMNFWGIRTLRGWANLKAVSCTVHKSSKNGQ